MNTIVFIILSAIKQSKLHLSSTIIARVSLFDYVIYFLADILLAVRTRWRMNSIAKYTNSAREMEFGSVVYCYVLDL